jgi:ubiquinone/menaquinone biosynthesis C-methylase UbiE
MEYSESDNRQAAWSAYWANGTLHSLSGSFSGNYGGALEHFWLNVFRLLPANSHVLDIATGNGALPKMLLDTETNLPMRIDAVDLAELAPSWIARSTPETRARVHFHARTPAEALPFADSSFDLCMSQYGIEYSELQRSIPQALRVTKPSGLIAWVMHHRESRPVQLACEDRAHCAWLLSPKGPFDAAAAAVIPAAQSSSPEARKALQQNAAAEKIRLQFNSAMNRLSTRAAATSLPDTLQRCAQTIMMVLQQAQTTGIVQAQTRLREVRQSVLHGMHRNNDLLAHAPATDTVARIIETIKAAYPEWLIVHRHISLGNALIGQCLIAGRKEVVARLQK